MRNLDSDRREPPFHRIQMDIADRIDRAELLPGDFLPTRSDLAVQYGVARATVDKAIAELARLGMIDSGSGRRTVVLDRGAGERVATTIGVLWSWPEDNERQGGDYLDLLFRGIREACSEFMLDVHFRSAPLYAWTELVEDKGAQGLLIVRPNYSDSVTIDRISASGIPLVLVPGMVDEEAATSVSPDNAGACEAAVDHLVSLGHTDLGFVGLTATDPDHFERLQAFLAAVARRGLVLRPEWICLAHERKPEKFRCRLGQRFTGASHPTAILSCEFMMTLALLADLREIGLKVPRDVSIITFDDPPAAAHLHPSLTAIALPTPLLGYRAIERLRDVILGQRVPLTERLPTRLVVRGSTAAR